MSAYTQAILEQEKTYVETTLHPKRDIWLERKYILGYRPGVYPLGYIGEAEVDVWEVQE